MCIGLYNRGITSFEENLVMVTILTKYVIPVLASTEYTISQRHLSA